MALINWNPTSKERDIQTVRTLLATEAGRVPMARDLGIPETIVDQPQTRAAAIVAAGIVDAVEKYAPETEIESITWTADMTGNFTPTVRLTDE